MLLERGERDDLKRPLMSGREHHRRGEAVLEGAQPIRRGDAPPVSRNEAREAELGRRGDEVVADASLVLLRNPRNLRALSARSHCLNYRLPPIRGPTDRLPVRSIMVN